MTWANGLILGLGGLLIAIPIILHLLMQPKPKKMIFPALRFLKEKQLASRSRMRLRHLLLLLMRCLLIALLALALAGPTVASREFGNWLTLGGIGISGVLVGIVLAAAYFRPKKNWLLIGILGALFAGHLGFGGWSAARLLGSDNAEILGDGQAPVAALIVIDTSPRMQYRSENKTRAEVATEMAQWLVRQFPLESQVCVLATDHDRPFFSVDVAAASRRIETLETAFVENPIPSALAEGLPLLEKAPQERKEIYIISDLTKQGWTGDNAKPVLKQLKSNPAISLFVIDVGVESPTNFSLSELELSNAEISEQGDFTVSTTINRIGGADQRALKMSVERPDPTRPVIRDGKVLFPEQVLAEQTSAVDVRENGSATASFKFSQPLTTGTYHGTVAIVGNDGLAIDNQRYFSVRVRSAWSVLVVHPENTSPKNLTATIAPSLRGEIGAASYDCTVITQTELSSQENLENFDAVFLLNPQPLDMTIWQRLNDYVTGGGGLAICLGHNAANGGIADASFQSESATRLLTGKLDHQWFSEQRDNFLSPQNLSHPLFQSFRKIETGLLWYRFPVFLHWGIEPDDRNEEFPTQTLLRYSNREPALIERRIGNGRVLVMTTPFTERAEEPDRRVWNELFIGQFFPAWLLVKSMTAYLVQDDADSLNLTAGQVARFDNDLRQFPETYQVYQPRTDKPPTTINAVENQIRFRFTNYPGQYRMKGVFDQRPLLRGFSVNLSAASTDLSRIEPAELDGVLGPERYQLAKRQDEIQRQQGTTRVGQEFYPLLVLMMLVVLAVEYLMSNRFYASR